jgi:hypothetical protein
MDRSPKARTKIPTPRDRLAPHATRRLGTIVVRNHLVASSEQGPALGLLSTLDTLLVLAFGERSILDGGLHEEPDDHVEWGSGLVGLGSSSYQRTTSDAMQHVKTMQFGVSARRAIIRHPCIMWTRRNESSA